MTEIGTNDAFVGKEAATTEKKLGRFMFVGHFSSSPYTEAEYFNRSTAHQITQWGDLAKYNCVAYFEPSAFERDPHMGHGEYRWGNIGGVGHNPSLAIQIMDPNPKVLMQVTKGMLKKRPNDPITIIDLYGNVFFP